MEECFLRFDKNKDNQLDIPEFESLFHWLFGSEKNGSVYTFPQNKINDTFEIFDTNSDGFISREEFSYCWNNWIKTILNPTCALLIIDVQNDFITGSLRLNEEPRDIIPPINHLINNVCFEGIFFSLDWHPPNHISFIDNIHLYEFDQNSPLQVDEAKVYDTIIYKGNPTVSQKLWPKHCVQNTWGSQLHKDLTVPDGAIKIYKGTDPTMDSYSAFWNSNSKINTELYNCLKKISVTDLFICGVAYDVCVRVSAVDSLGFGFRTIVVDDCCEGVNCETIKETKHDLIKREGIIINSSDVKAMVEGKDRRPELGYYLAKRLKM